MRGHSIDEHEVIFARRVVAAACTFRLRRVLLALYFPLTRGVLMQVGIRASAASSLSTHITQLQ